ncbi:MAG: ATP-dependent metallopeptidase FtsH/Yme1/Tma family protein [Rhodospirillales bacterium]|nr:ATP-dependent metallopeptidase FtsH/Yme1/Tma family protein [Rhodospirillales bacterium]MCB9980710.1 ATP-dependent metallopeptidase FtsH/Yme1/Tma family protein [Rhodospirillales bacterium]
MNSQGRNLILWLGIGLVLAILFSAFENNNRSQFSTYQKLAYSDFIADANAGKITDVTIKGNEIRGTHSDSREVFSTIVPDNENIVERLKDTGVRINAEQVDPDQISLLSILLSWFPMLLLIGVWIFFMRQMQGGKGGGALGFGRSRAKMLTEQQGRITFDDVAGIEEAKQELQEIVEFLKDPGKFQRLGGKIPKGALLVGPPGTGKTLTARAVAGEANVPFFTISGSDFVEMFVGVGASRVRDMFEQAKKNAPCIIFIDEIDAVGRHRGAGLGGGNDEREQTLNQLLVEMDGFDDNEGIILIAATNRPDVLDPALLRPGRFDRQIVVPLPDVKGREQILNVHMKKVPLSQNVNVKVIARGTPGFSGADLANLVNEAALLAARRGNRVVTMNEFEDAKDKVMMGTERRSMAMSENEKKLTAYHEAGHAIIGLNMVESDPIHKATIIPRGRALGMVMRLPENDRISMSKAKLEADMAVAVGGRIAEEMIFGADHVTTGASSDISMATNVARRMVTEWGMSDKLGFQRYVSNQEEVFLGHSVSQSKNVSDKTAAIIDEEVRRIIDTAYKIGEKILKEKEKDLHTLAKALLEYETLSGDEIATLLKGLPIIRDDDVDDNTTGGTRRSSVPSSGGVIMEEIKEKIDAVTKPAEPQES